MFIIVTYKDAPELSSFNIQRSSSDLTDTSAEKTLLVNPVCQVRVMLEYIRKKCKLGCFTQFDLAEASGLTKKLFDMETYEYATDLFEHKKTYYLIVLKMDGDKLLAIYPQLSHDNPFYADLLKRVHNYLVFGELLPISGIGAGKSTPPKPAKKK